MKTSCEGEMKLKRDSKRKFSMIVLCAVVAAWTCGVHGGQVSAQSSRRTAKSRKAPRSAQPHEMLVGNACCDPATGECQTVSGDVMCMLPLVTHIGTACSGIEACYFLDDSCQDVDALCCGDMGGMPGGPGSSCATLPQACCMPDGTCQDITSFQCRAQGGTPGSVGSVCDGTPQACCTGAACEVVDPACCAGVPAGPGTDCADTGEALVGQLADGVADVCDNCPFDGNPKQIDNDNDSVGDACDNCSPTNPLHGCTPPDYLDCSNPGQEDCDTDSVGNICDNCRECPNEKQVDSDGDGAGDGCDNCPNIENQNQSNCDGDGYGDVCDTDKDNDGVPDDFDVCDFTPFPLPPGVVVRPNGTLVGDLDGDCDVDGDDLALLEGNLTGQGCADGLQVSEECDAPAPGDPPFSEPAECFTGFDPYPCDP